MNRLARVLIPDAAFAGWRTNDDVVHREREKRNREAEERFWRWYGEALAEERQADDYEEPPIYSARFDPRSPHRLRGLSSDRHAHLWRTP